MNFSLDLTRATRNLSKNNERVVRGTWLGLVGRIIKSTPVANVSLWENPDFGYVGGSLRGGWNVSIGAPDFTETGIIDTNGRGTQAKASAAMDGYRVGNPLYLTNPLPYAVAVENGWSSQAPVGMLRVNLAQTQSILNKAAK